MQEYTKAHSVLAVLNRCEYNLSGSQELIAMVLRCMGVLSNYTFKAGVGTFYMGMNLSQIEMHVVN